MIYFLFLHHIIYKLNYKTEGLYDLTFSEAGKFLRGAAAVIAGIILLTAPSGCSRGGSADVPGQGEKVIYNDLNYTLIQGETVHKPGASDDTEYVFIPITIKNDSDNNIIFSSEVCIKAYALPSGDECPHGDKTAIAEAKSSVRDFALFDGIIHGHEDTEGWLVFEVPLKTESIQIDFYTGYGSDEFISFTCDL